MFGYIIANKSALTDEQLARYRACYCGLCRSLKERHGSVSRLTLNYDMTFLVLLLSSMYEPTEFAGEERCIMHPAKKRAYWRSCYTEYAADMNVALGYYNCLDDWKDDKSLVGRAGMHALRGEYEKVRASWPRQCAAIDSCMNQLSRIEKMSDDSPDDAVNCFGRLMGELFACREDSWAEKFRSFGQALGRFIYLMDACVDLDRDKKRGSYNPLIAMGRADISEDEKKSMLTMLIGECTAEFEKLPILQDVDIMRNILYSGVWAQYAARRRKGAPKNDK